MKFTLFKIFAVVFLVAPGLVAAASTEGSLESGGGDRVLKVSSAARNGVSRKHYPGGADEDDLQVQATLPIPSRTLDGSSALAPNGGGTTSDGESTPAND